MLRRFVSQKFADVSEVPVASIIVALMVAAASTSEMSASFCEATPRNIPEAI
jgi:hypothetical protein